MIIPILVLAIIFVLVAIRQIGKFRLEIWQIMLFGAAVVLIIGQISPLNAIKSVNLNVMLFLFGMFVVGQALEESGYLSHISYKIFKNAKSADQLLLFILFGMGIASAFLMNDTIAIIGTPVVLLLAKKHCLPAKPLLLALAFAVTIGSVMSPIGNPQNLLIALNGGIDNPFITFLVLLFIPTIINLFLTYFLLRLLYKKHFHCNLNHSQEPIKDHKLAFISKVSLLLLIVLIFVKIILVLVQSPFDFSLTYIALLSALPPLFFSSKRVEIIRRIDWHTLIFFAAMFVVMQAVWNAGFFQMLLDKSNIEITSLGMILLVSVLLSQLISNVPLVALYLPMLLHAGVATTEMITLAAGSTIAGNLTILGAASNVIIIQNAEKKANETVTFWEFSKIGIPLTLINALVFLVFLKII